MYSVWNVRELVDSYTHLSINFRDFIAFNDYQRVKGNLTPEVVDIPRLDENIVILVDTIR